MGSDLKGKTNEASLAFNKWEWPKNLGNGEMDQMKDSDFVSIFDSKLIRKIQFELPRCQIAQGKIV